MNRRVGAAAALLVMLAGSSLWAQPQRGRPGRTDEQQAEQGRPLLEQVSPERLRERLADIRTNLEESAARLQTAISMLDEGKSVSEVIESLGGPTRVRRMAEAWQQWGRPGFGPGVDRPGDRPGAGPPGPDSEARPWMGRQVEPEEVLAFLRERAPGLAERITTLREEDPERAEGVLMRIGPRVAEVLSTREHDPELGELMAKDFALGMRFVDAVERYRQARASGDADAIEQTGAELREVAGAQVDLRLQRREHELKMLASRLEAMQGEIDGQRADREKLIDEMVEQAERGRFRGGPADDRPERGGPPDGAGRRERRGGGG